MRKRGRRRRDALPPADAGGSGGSSAPEPPPAPPTIKTTRLYARVVLEGWPVPIDAKARVAEFLIDVATGTQRAEIRERLSAARALLEADRLNLATLSAGETQEATVVDEDLVRRAQEIREGRERRMAADAKGEPA